MLRRLRILLALGFLIASPALADVITDVTVNGSISGTGTMTLRCFFQGSPPPGCYQVVPGRYIQNVNTSFSTTNTQLGNLSNSSLGTGVGPTDLHLSASQSTAATADSLSVDLFTSFSIFPIGAVINGYHVDLQNSIAVGFDLTTESLLQVSGFLFFGDTQLFDSNGNPLFTGPCCSGPLILEPGMYQFTQSLPITRGASFPFGDPGIRTNIESVLDAKFTPIPEPRGPGLILLIGIGGLACMRRRITGSSSKMGADLNP